MPSAAFHCRLASLRGSSMLWYRCLPKHIRRPWSASRWCGAIGRHRAEPRTCAHLGCLGLHWWSCCERPACCPRQPPIRRMRQRWLLRQASDAVPENSSCTARAGCRRPIGRTLRGSFQLRHAGACRRRQSSLPGSSVRWCRPRSQWGAGPGR